MKMITLMISCISVDAFGQDGIDAPDGIETPSWMNDNTLFYWGWWISWAPLVGVFLAEVSKGNT